MGWLELGLSFVTLISAAVAGWEKKRRYEAEGAVDELDSTDSLAHDVSKLTKKARKVVDRVRRKKR